MQKARKRHVEATGHPSLAKHFADNITWPPFGDLHNVLKSSTLFKNLALMLDALGDVSEVFITLQSESTTLSKAYKLVKRSIRALAQFKEGHSGEHTKTAEASCAAGVLRDVVLTSY